MRLTSDANVTARNRHVATGVTSGGAKAACAPPA